MIKKVYKNIIELAKDNGKYQDWTNEVGGPISYGSTIYNRTLEDYLDDYSDRNIVSSFLNDVLEKDIKFKVYPVWDDGILDWTKTAIEIF